MIHFFTCYSRRFQQSKKAVAILFTAFLAVFGLQAGAQCTPAAINWNWQYKAAAFASGTRFAFGVNNVVMSYSGAVTSPATPADNTFTGLGSGGYGKGNNLEFIAGAGTITFTFASEVTGIKFAIYDLDNSQTATVTATNAAASAVNVTMAAPNAISNVTIAGSGTASASAAGGSAARANTDTTSGVNIDIAGPVKTITITTTGAADAVFFSNISGCVTGNFVNGYDSSLAPDPGTPTYVLAANSSSSIYGVDVATGTAIKVCTSSVLSSINSLAYDAYKQQVYYCDNTATASNKAVYRYDIKTCTETKIIADVTAAPFNIPVNSNGLGAGGASFSNGCLFLGVDIGLTTLEDDAIWRIAFDSTGNPISAARSWGVLSYPGSGSQFYDWGDFVISNGVLYNFNRAAAAAPHTNIEHYDLNLQDTTAGFTNTVTTQAALDYYGNVYNLDYNISPYDKNGNFGQFHVIAGDGWQGPSNDAAEYFKFPADYGDAPISYGKPSHRIRECAGLGITKLGATLDYELNPVYAIPGQPANGDNNANYTGSGTTNDEDAFTSFPVLSVGALSYTLSGIPVTNTTGASAVLTGWIDFNQDGVFSAAEYATATIAANATTATLTWNMSALTPNTDVKVGLTYARFRIQPTALTDNAATVVDERSTAATTGGEVEDYQIEIKQLSVYGNVYHDVDGLTDNIVDGTGFNNPSSTPLYAYLVQSGTIVASMPVAADGSYKFEGIVNQNSSYNIVISTTNSAVNTAAPTSANLPANWVAVGDAFGTYNSAGTGNETGMPDVMIAVNTTNRVVQNVNFGIEQRPLSTVNILASQLNPGGTQVVNITPANFLGSDPDAALNRTRHLLSFPSFVDSISIVGVGGYTAATWPAGGVLAPLTAQIYIDPSNNINAVDTAIIPFTYVDSAGQESLVAGAVEKPFTELSLAGTVYDDNNAGTISGTPTNTIGANTMYANLVNVATNKVVGSVPVNANGTYTLKTAQGVQLAAASAYKITVTNTAGTVGATPPSTSLINAGNTAEGTTTTGDGTPDGSFTLPAITASATGFNFAIDQLPSTTQPAALASQVNPGSTNFVNVPLTNFAGTDPEDLSHIRYLHFTRFPDSVTTFRVTINGTAYAYTKATFPATGIYAPLTTGATATLVDIDPVNGSVTAAIPFKVLDSATSAYTAPATVPATRFESPDSATVLVPFTDFLLSGNVFDDANGMKDNSVNGVDTNMIGSSTFYANLLLNSVVVGYVPVNSNGTYTLGTAQGLKTNTPISGTAGFTVAISKIPGTIGIALPAASQTLTDAAYTGESLAPTGSDGQPADGKILVATLTSNITGVNFGVDVLPVAYDATIPSQVNPGGTIQATVPASYFTGTDAEEGTADSVHFTVFPTNVTSIYIDGTGYTATATAGFTTFPAAGITVPFTGLAVTIDPSLSTATFSAYIPYKVKDLAGKESALQDSVTAPFRDLGIDGRIYDDHNGITDALINGTPTYTANGAQLYAYLINTGTGKIVAKYTPTTGGLYTFGTADGITQNTNYAVVVTTTNQAVVSNTTLASTVIPANNIATLNATTVATAEGNTTTGDGYPNSIDSLSLGIVPIDSINFGIDILPTATSSTLATRVNPGGTDTTGIAFASFSKADVDGTVSGIRITPFTLATANITSVQLNGVVYTTIPAGGLVVHSTDMFAIDPFGGAISAAIPFVSIDDAGKESTTGATLTVPYTDLTLSGIVYDDPDGGTISGTAKGVIGANTLYANLVDSTTGLVIADTAVTAATGAYTFGTAQGLHNKHTFKVVVTNTPGIIGNVPPATALVNAVNTAEGLVAAGDGTPDGIVTVPVGTANVVNVNFAIDQLPTPTGATLAAQLNPGGKQVVSVNPANTSFVGTDPESATSTKVHFTKFPSNADSISIDGVGYTPATFPAAGVITANYYPVFYLDPMNGAVTDTIPYKVIDAAGQESLTTANTLVPFTELSIAGTVYDDNNGGAIGGGNAVATNVIGANTMYANLVNTVTNKVVGVEPVLANGTFTLTTADGVQKVAANVLKVVVTNTAGTVGNTPPSTALTNAGNTADGHATYYGTAGDGVPDGQATLVGGVSASVTGVNFAIDRYPATIQPAALASQVNPGSTNFVNVPLANFSGTDPEDGTHVSYLHFTRFPDSVTTFRVTVNGTQYPYTKATFPATGIYIPQTVGAVASIVDIDPVNGSVTARIPFRVLDSATSAYSAPATVPTTRFESPDSSFAIIPFTDLTLAGTVYDDGNGMKDNMVNGTGAGTIAGTPLYANLALNGVVQGYVPVNADGTYILGTAQGLKVNVPVSGTTGFSVVVSKTPGLIAAANDTVTGAAHTGESLAPTGNDGYPADGKILVGVTTANVSGVNFGFDVLPVGVDTTVTSRVNAPAVLFPVAPGAFRGTDADGTVDSIIIPSFPALTTALTVNGVPYTAGTFPAGGIHLKADPSTYTIFITPSSTGNTTPYFLYQVKDNAGLLNNHTDTVRVPFRDLNIDGRVYDDHTGISDSLINGTPTGTANGTQLYAYLINNATARPRPNRRFRLPDFTCSAHWTVYWPIPASM